MLFEAVYYKESKEVIISLTNENCNNINFISYICIFLLESNYVCPFHNCGTNFIFIFIYNTQIRYCN